MVNALQFKAMSGHSLSDMELKALEHAMEYLSTHGVNYIIFSLPIVDISLSLYVFSTFLPKLMPPLSIFLPNTIPIDCRIEAEIS